MTAPRDAVRPALLEAVGVTHTFGAHRAGHRVTPVLRDISLSLHRGDTLGLVGESGSGKSTLSRILARLLDPTAGDVRFDGASVIQNWKQRRREFRQRVQVVFQDPFSSLDPRHTVTRSVSEPLLANGVRNRDELRARSRRVLESVGLGQRFDRAYPHQLSGGQAQRVCIARSLILEPEVLILDEPLTALDVSVQGQLIELLQRLKREQSLTMLFVSHDLAVVALLADTVAVLDHGDIVEIDSADKVLTDPAHEYTKTLVDAVFDIEGKVR